MRDKVDHLDELAGVRWLGPTIFDDAPGSDVEVAMRLADVGSGLLGSPSVMTTA